MSRDLKDLIDSIEIKNRSHAELERTVESLREELRRLAFTVKEQKLLIQEQREKLQSGEGGEVPAEVEILKEMVLSQRQELIKKDKQLEILEEKIDRLNKELSGDESGDLADEENEDLLIAKKVIVRLTDENEKLRAKFEDAKEEIHQSQKELEDLKDLVVYLEQEIDKSEHKENHHLIKQDSEALDDANYKITKLEAEIEELQDIIIDLNQEIEEHKKAAKIKDEILRAPAIHQVIDEDSEELRIANKKIENLITELEDFEAQVSYLSEELEKTKKEKEYLEENSELNKVKAQNEKFKKDLETMNLTITNLVQDIEGHLNEISEQNKTISKKNTKIDSLQNKIDSLERLNKELKEEVITIEDTPKPPKAVAPGQWHDPESVEVIKMLREENQQLKELVNELKQETEPPLVLEDIPIKQKEVTTDLKRDYNLLVKESQELIDENQRLKELIIEFQEQKTEAPIVVGIEPEASDTFEDESEETIRFLKDENQDLLDRMLALNLKLQEKETTIETLERVRKNLIEKHKKELDEQLLDFEETKQKLTEEIEGLKERSISKIKLDPRLSIQQAVPASYQSALFTNLINRLDGVQKEEIIDLLLRHLETTNVDVKRFIMNILSQIKKARVLESLKTLANDPNWLIRISLAKILSNYDYAKIKNSLKTLLEDKDPDVRETASVIFKKIKLSANKKSPEEECFHEMKEFTPDRWNWCEEAGKWVFVKVKGDGERQYEFQLEPPKEFMELTMKMMKLNEKLMSTTDIDENQRIFEELMKISQKMQDMRKGGTP